MKSCVSISLYCFGFLQVDSEEEVEKKQLIPFQSVFGYRGDAEYKGQEMLPCC